MAEAARRPAGLLDTSVIIDLEGIDPTCLPLQSSVSAITLAELAAGPHVASDSRESAVRQARLQFIEGHMEALPFDFAAARAFGRLYAEVAESGRKVRGRRTADLLIAATALAAGVPLYTRNPADFAGLEGLIDVVGV